MTLRGRTQREVAQRANFQHFLKKIVGANLAVIEIGSGKAVPTIRYISEDLVSEFGSSLIRVNPRDYDGPEGTISIPLGAKEAIEKLVN